MADPSDLAPSSGQNISDIFDDRPIGFMQWRVFAFCLAAGLFEGFDAQAVGFTAPAMSRELSIPMANFGWILAAAHLGVVIGAFVLGPVADRIGRKWLITMSMLVVGLFALANVVAVTFVQLLTVRFIMGLGAGGALAVFAVLAGEYAPPRSKFSIISTIWISVPAGGLLSALVSALVLDSIGWKFVYILGGGVTLMLAAMMVVFLPESPSFLIARNAPREKIDRLLAQIWPKLGVPQGPLTVETKPTEKTSVLTLFSTRFRRLTFVLWAAAFGDYLAVLVIVAWSTVLLSNAGMATSTAALVVMVNNLGGLIGILTIGRLLQKMNPRLVLVSFLLLGAIATMAMAMSAPAFLPTVIASGIAGFLLGGCVAGLSAIATVYYPTTVRSGGVGWLLGAGRTGGILGTVMVGALVGWQWSIVGIYAVCAALAVMAACAVFFLPRAEKVA